jgi:flagellin
MAAVINTNMASLFAQGSLNNAQNNLATSVQRLSSGLRINSAADDASGLSIAQTMAGHIKSLDQAALNAQQAINLAQTADTSLSTVQDILLRMQQLSVQGANGSLSNSQRGAIVTELGVLNTQINSFAAGTTYNGIQLLGGRDSTRSAGSIIAGAIGTGLAVGTSATVSALNVTGAAAGSYTISNSAGVVTLGNGTQSQSVTLTALASAGDTQTVNFSNLGVSFVLTSSEASVTAAAMGTGLDSATLTVTAGSANTLSFQIGASPTASGDSISISTNNISTINSDLTSLTDVGFSITNNFSNTGLNYLSANSASATDALWNTAFTTLNGAVSTAINDISSTRATLGAQMNQLGFINTTVQAQSANEQAARSTLVDTNYSAETASLTKGQIMQQAATAMLAQANQMPNVILSLLK